MFRTALSRVARLARKVTCPPILNRARTSPPLRARLSLEQFEPREVPAVITWRGAVSYLASEPLNWSGGPSGSLPGQYDDLSFTSQPVPGPDGSPPGNPSAF